MHNSYKQFLFHSFLSALHVLKESSRSSSGARHNILYYTVQSCLQHDCIDCTKLCNTVQSVQSCLQHDCTDCTKMCNTVYYAVLLMMNDQIRSKHVQQTKNCRIKIDYKNCASRWSLTHRNMMHGAHKVKLNPLPCLFHYFSFQCSVYLTTYFSLSMSVITFITVHYTRDSVVQDLSLHIFYL